MKRIAAAALAFILLFCLSSAMAGNAGTASDPLISKSYIDDTFIPATVSSGQAKINSALQAVYDEAVKKIPSGGQPKPGYSFTGSYKVLDLEPGAYVTGITGTSFMLLSGKGEVLVSSGTVIDVSTGQEIKSGSALALRQRYFCAENTSADFKVSDTSKGAVVNYYAVSAGSATDDSFSDVAPDKYYYDAVYWALRQGITTGDSETTFGPDKSCTRAQVVTFLWRAAGSPKPTGQNPFTDVTSDKYYYAAVMWAVKNGITNGESATTFGPDKSCTRAQIVTFLWRFSGSPKPSGSANPFTDVASGQYYYDAVLWAVKEGITKGDSDTTFAPDKPCTRAQTVTFLYRLLA